MSESALKVAAHYNLKTTQKSLDWFNFLFAIALIYGGKFHSISERQRAEKAEKRNQAAANVAPFGLAPANV